MIDGSVDAAAPSPRAPASAFDAGSFGSHRDASDRSIADRPDGSSRSDTDGGSDADADLPTPPIGNPVHVWTEDSRAVEVTWFSFWDGGYQWVLDRAQLSAEQLELLGAIETVTPEGPCAADIAEVGLRVIDTPGTAREYYAMEQACGAFGGVQVDYGQLAALLETVSCLSAKGYDGSTLAAAAQIATGDGCRHGLFNAYEQTPTWWFLVDVERPGRQRVTIHGCGERQLGLELFDASGVFGLASTPAADVCPVLEHDFVEPGTYALRVEMTAGGSAGDFFLSVARVP